MSESIKSYRENTPRTIAFTKPYGRLPCLTDLDGRQTMAEDYIELPGVYAAGRLDLDSEGLLLLTSDDRLAHHRPAAYFVEAEYD